MKTHGLMRIGLFILLSGSFSAFGQQDRVEVPGDHFSLEGALELFKKSTSPEEFERLLNSPAEKVNNLDLNQDGDIDYIKVIDRNEGNIHAFVIQAVISETESQDVAVIELEKLDNGKAVLQITGDADVYGIETIIEPTEEVRVNAGTSTARSVVNVWAWPSVQYIYSPYYTSAWISPWGWNARPVWWSPWSPVAYYQYNPWWQPYRPYYSVCYSHRVVYGPRIYQPYRTTSVIFYNRHHSQVAYYRSHHGYNNSYNDRQQHYSNRPDTDGRTRTNYDHHSGRSSGSTGRQYERQEERRSSDQRNDSWSRSRSSSNDQGSSTTRSQQRHQPSSRSWSGGSDHNSSRNLSIAPRTSTQHGRSSGGFSTPQSGSHGGGSGSGGHKRGRN